MIAAALLACAVHVAPVTVQAIIGVESGGNPIAINVNHLGHALHPSTAREAATLARHYIARGYSVDLGLMQINSRNLASVGLTIEQALTPCRNIAAGGRILLADYSDAEQRFGAGQGALLAALSAYNTGSFSKGFENGYVNRYMMNGASARVILATTTKRPDPYSATTSVYTREAFNVAIQ